VVSKEEALEGIFDSWLREHGERVDEDAKMALFKKYEVFELSTRSIRERRQPKMEVSDLKGITNNGNRKPFTTQSATSSQSSRPSS